MFWLGLPVSFKIGGGGGVLFLNFRLKNDLDLTHTTTDVNKNAYIECSIHGYGFCKSACAAFSSLLANILLVAAVNGVGGLLLLMLKLMVASGTAMIG